MKSWKVIIEFQGEILEILLDAQYYSDAYVDVGKKYPGCIVKSIAEVKEKIN